MYFKKFKIQLKEFKFSKIYFRWDGSVQLWKPKSILGANLAGSRENEISDTEIADI